MKATKLENATVQYISLVERGANRIPFRIIKRDKETGMINLSTIFKKEQAETSPEPRETKVVALVVEKTSQLPQVTALIKKAGFVVNHVEEPGDGTVVFKQVDEALDFDVLTTVKMGDNLLVLVDEQKVSKSVEEGITGESLRQYGFLPSPDLALIELYHSVTKSISEVTPETVDAFETALKTDLAAFHEYAMTWIEEMPASIRKMDLDAAIQECNASAQPIVVPPVEAEVTAEVAKSDEQPPVVETPAPVAAVSAEPKGLDMEGLIAAITKAVGGKVDALSDTMQTIAGSVEKLNSQVSVLSEEQVALTQKMDGVETMAKAADLTASSTLVGAPPRGDSPIVRSKKSEAPQSNDPRTGVFDTAYLPRSARKQSA
jgi:hypothetical protein